MMHAFFSFLWPSPGFGLPAVLAPCSPKRIVFTWLPSLATTMCDFFGWLGVRLGLLNPATPALLSLGSAIVKSSYGQRTFRQHL
jgi:hypothetical protein